MQSNSSNSDGIIINPGALTHYGISLRDGLLDSKLPIIEVHLSNIHSREEFRNKSVVSDISVGQVVGLGWHGYIYALNFLKDYVNTKWNLQFIRVVIMTINYGELKRGT